MGVVISAQSDDHYHPGIAQFDGFCPAVDQIDIGGLRRKDKG
jgi:hypothetical protein